jgi:hypothetical protein
MSDLSTEISSNVIEQAKVEAQQATIDAGAAKDASIIAKDASVAAQTAAESARDGAMASQTAAAGSATQAGTHESNALTNSNVAASAKTASETARDLAEKWASELEDTEVTTGKHSALHWAMKAQQWAQATTNSLVFKGGYDASSNTAPTTPADQSLAEFYRITATGTISGVVYNTGDSIIWDPISLAWFKVDNTDAVLNK